jgi:hypothetical protein
MIYKLSMMDPLGYFHTHPEGCPSPSDDDIEDMKPHEIEIIISVERKERTVPWSYDPAKRMLSGVLGEFRFEMCAYMRAKKDLQKVEKLDLLCPFALGIGSKYFDTQAKPPGL